MNVSALIIITTFMLPVLETSFISAPRPKIIGVLTPKLGLPAELCEQLTEQLIDFSLKN